MNATYSPTVWSNEIGQRKKLMAFLVLTFLITTRNFLMDKALHTNFAVVKYSTNLANLKFLPKKTKTKILLLWVNSKTRTIGLQRLKQRHVLN